jgi:hypothetical protein
MFKNKYLDSNILIIKMRNKSYNIKCLELKFWINIPNQKNYWLIDVK